MSGDSWPDFKCCESQTEILVPLAKEIGGPLRRKNEEEEADGVRDDPRGGARLARPASSTRTRREGCGPGLEERERRELKNHGLLMPHARRGWVGGTGGNGS